MADTQLAPVDLAVVLASGSPRRRELLTQLGLEFTVVVPNIDESVHPGEQPRAYVGRLAQEKAAAVVQQVGERSLVIAADTTVDLGGDILGKPVDSADAVAMLRRLSGRTHRVHTGVAMCRAGRMVHDVVTSMVSFTPLTDATIEWYVGTGEPLDKAGAYAIQGAGGAFVQTVRGSVSSIVGLPLHTVVRLAADLGCRFATAG